MNSSYHHRLHMSPQEDDRQKESKIRSIAVADDNARRAISKQEAKAQKALDDITRYDYATQLHELDLANEKQHEQEKFDRGMEYGECLRQQIMDDEKRKHAVSHSPQNTTAFCEAFVDATEQNRKKIMKQREYKDELDECVKQKNEIKKNIQLRQSAEDKRRDDFSKKHDDDYVKFNEKRQQEFDSKQHQRDVVSEMWKTEHDFKTSEQGKQMDIETDDVNFEDDDSKSFDLIEIQRRIAARKALLEQLQSKIEASYRRFEEEKKKREELIVEIQREENKLKKLLQKEQQEYTENNESDYRNNIEGAENTNHLLKERMFQDAPEEKDSSHSKFY